MNVKPGDLAYVVVPPGFRPLLDKRFVTVNEDPADGIGQDDMRHWDRVATREGIARQRSHNWIWYCTFHNAFESEYGVIKHMWILDSWLRPIRKPGDDEADLLLSPLPFDIARAEHDLALQGDAIVTGNEIALIVWACTAAVGVPTMIALSIHLNKDTDYTLLDLLAAILLGVFTGPMFALMWAAAQVVLRKEAMNAFQMAKPRGPDVAAPAVKPRKAEHAPRSPIRALDVNGRPVVSIAPRATHFHFETALESRAQQDKRRKIIGQAPGGR